MKTTKPNAQLVWKQFEDSLVPHLKLSVIDRAAYSHLLRHTRFEGRLRLRFSIPWLSRGIRLSSGATREAVRRLVAHGALRLIQRTKAGHVAEVRLPAEICSVESPHRAARGSRRVVNLEEVDFMRTKALRKAIHSRERSLCFYCLRGLDPMFRCLDHVIPKVQFGRNSYRNLVSCCIECNSQKRDLPATDFLRALYRERRLTAAELTARLRALDALASGKLRPVLGVPVLPKPSTKCHSRRQ